MGAGANGSREFGGTPPERFVAIFDDSENLHRAAVEGLGIVLGRMTLARPLIEAGRLVQLFDERFKAEFAHYLVYPPRSRDHAGLAVFRDWLLEEAQDYETSRSDAAAACTEAWQEGRNAAGAKAQALPRPLIRRPPRLGLGWRPVPEATAWRPSHETSAAVALVSALFPVLRGLRQ